MHATRAGRVAAISTVLTLLSLSLPGVADVAAQERETGGTTTSDSFSLEGLVVTAAPTTMEEDAVASHVTILGADELQHLGDRSLAEALRDVAGLHVVRGGSFGAVTSLFLRGGESDYTLVLVDGVQVNQAGGGFDLAALTTDAVERVEIVRGPASALYGSDAVSGVVHVITRTGSGAPVTNVAFGAGSFGRRDLSADLRGGTGRSSYGVSVARHATDGIFDVNNQSAILVLSGTGRFQPDDRTRLEVNLRASDRTYHFPTNSAGAVVDDNAFTFSDGVTARVSAERQIASRVSVEATVGMNQVDGGTDDAVDGPADTLGFYGFTSLDHFRRSVGEIRAHLRLDQATLTGGFEYEEERQRSFTESLSQFGPSSGRSFSRRENLGYFLHATGDLAGATYQVGSRLEDNERFGTSATWQLGVAAPTPWATDGVIRASLGTGIKEPTFFETFATGFARGNPELDPERSLSWEVGVEERVGGLVTVGATYFDQRFEDLIQYTSAPPSPEDPNYFNVAAARARGVELDVDLRRGAWSGGASWSWVDTEVTDSGFDDGPGAGFVDGEPLLRRPTWKGSAHAAVALGRFDVSARLRHTGARQDRDFSTFPATPVVLDGHQLLSLSVDMLILDGSQGGPDVSLELRGENLLDQEYQELFGFPTPGRGLYLGGRMTLGG